MTALALQPEKQASKLSIVERERLAERILAPLESLRLTSVYQAWIEEAERRYSYWKRGHSKAIPAAQALADIRKALHR